MISTFFCECQYLYILRQKITITLTFIKTLGYRFHGSRTTLKRFQLLFMFYFTRSIQVSTPEKLVSYAASAEEQVVQNFKTDKKTFATESW